jgi:hypothetical protein
MIFPEKSWLSGQYLNSSFSPSSGSGLANFGEIDKRKAV